VLGKRKAAREFGHRNEMGYRTWEVKSLQGGVGGGHSSQKRASDEVVSQGVWGEKKGILWEGEFNVLLFCPFPRLEWRLKLGSVGMGGLVEGRKGKELFSHTGDLGTSD